MDDTHNRIFNGSVLVVAHPDDEILWFSSVINHVDKIIICYFNSKENPTLGANRLGIIGRYPKDNMSPLRLNESDTFDRSNWENPVTTPYGIEIFNNGSRDDNYKLNYQKLTTLLRTEISGYRNVFTHSPWGEYGHEEHVQVFRAVEQIKKEIPFDVWFPNYVSHKSARLMLTYRPIMHSDFLTMETDLKTAKELKRFYEDHGCWTWLDNWRWPDKECFLRLGDTKSDSSGANGVFPLNFITVDIPCTEKHSRHYDLSFRLPHPAYFKKILARIPGMRHRHH